MRPPTLQWDTGQAGELTHVPSIPIVRPVTPAPVLVMTNPSDMTYAAATAVVVNDSAPVIHPSFSPPSQARRWSATSRRSATSSRSATSRSSATSRKGR